MRTSPTLSLPRSRLSVSYPYRPLDWQTPSPMSLELYHSKRSLCPVFFFLEQPTSHFSSGHPRKTMQTLNSWKPFATPGFRKSWKMRWYPGKRRSKKKREKEKKKRKKNLGGLKKVQHERHKEEIK